MGAEEVWLFQDVVGTLDESGKVGLQDIIQFAHIRQAKKAEDLIKKQPSLMG